MRDLGLFHGLDLCDGGISYALVIGVKSIKTRHIKGCSIMDQLPKISTSFVQDQAHQTKTEKFIAIQPSEIAGVLANHGFDLVSLKSGKARLADRADHQTTIARYRSRDPLTISSGGREMFMDLVFKVPHLYGALQAFVGTFRQVCTNGLVVGEKFATGRVRHVGDALSQLQTLIPTLVSQHDTLVDTIRAMQARPVSAVELSELTKAVARLRLGQNDKIVSIQYDDLIKVRRQEDSQNDLFSVMNVLQENVMRHGLRYTTQTDTVDNKGFARTNMRNMTARPVTRTRQGDTESVRSVDLNASIWDEATKLLKAG